MAAPDRLGKIEVAQGKTLEELTAMIIKPTGGANTKSPHEDTAISQGAPAADINMHNGVIETEIIIYIYETGTAPNAGSTAEIKGDITVTGAVNRKYDIDVGLPERTTWAQNNNGLGRMTNRVILRTLMIPPDFSVSLYVQGGFTRESIKIADWRVVFADHTDWLWGFWWWFGSSPENSNYKAYIAWSVKDGAGSQGPGGISP